GQTPAMAKANPPIMQSMDNAAPPAFAPSVPSPLKKLADLFQSANFMFAESTNGITDPRHFLTQGDARGGLRFVPQNPPPGSGEYYSMGLTTKPIKLPGGGDALVIGGVDFTQFRDPDFLKGNLVNSYALVFSNHPKLGLRINGKYLG